MWLKSHLTRELMHSELLDDLKDVKLLVELASGSRVQKVIALARGPEAQAALLVKLLKQPIATVSIVKALASLDLLPHFLLFELSLLVIIDVIQTHHRTLTHAVLETIVYEALTIINLLAIVITILILMNRVDFPHKIGREVKILATHKQKLAKAEHESHQGSQYLKDTE